MSKLLNRLKKTLLIRVPGAHPVSPSTYEPPIPRVALGIVGVAMTVFTIAVSVILPAHMDSGNREPRTLAATQPASVGLVTVTRIEVVSAREPGSSTVSMRIGEAALPPGRLARTTSPAIVRVSSTDH
jgi:hypothetical protein